MGVGENRALKEKELGKDVASAAVFPWTLHSLKQQLMGQGHKTVTYLTSE